jgi:hypothetical protein
MAITIQSIGKTGRVYLAILLILVGLYSGIVSAAEFKQTFPRIAGIEIGSSRLVTNPDYREALSRHDLLILGMWRGWNKPDDVTGELLSIRDVVVDIKRRAAAKGNNGILVGKYTVFNESSADVSNTASSPKWNKLHSEIGPGYPVDNDWWARTRRGDHTSSYPGNWLTNVTEYVQRDANGDTWPEWAVTFDYNLYFKDIPEMDIWYFDNWFYRPRVKVDWDGDGTDDDKNDESVRRAYRKGYVNALRRAKQLAPNVIMMGNVDGEVSTNDGMLTEPEFRGQLTALYEGAMGLSYSSEGWGSWEIMMKQYQTTVANAQHNVAAMTVHGPKDDYAFMRYGLASSLMDNGYYYYTSIEDQYRSSYWYDEYDVKLGRAIDPPQFSAWKSGVYMRRFENGMALVNPKGNGRRTIQIEPGYQRISGKQDPRTNNGQSADSVTLDERDGIILVRGEGFEPAVRPKPPVMNAIFN